MDFYNIIIGVMLLLFGRRLFWLFVGLAGFLIGLELARLYFIEQPHWLQLTIAISLGCLGALLAVVAQRLAFAIGGFFAGVFLALRIGRFFALPHHGPLLLIVAGLGVIGCLLALVIMDPAITLLACLVGAGAVVGALPLGPTPGIVLFVILAVAGYLFQGKTLRSGAEDGSGGGQA
jgi:hypothetical protein